MEKINYDGDPTTYDSLIQNGFDFSIEEVVRRGWELFKAFPIGFIAYFLLMALVEGAFNRIFGQMLGGIFSLITGSLFSAGFYIVADRASQGKSLEFGHFFEGFRFYSQLIPAALVTGLMVAAGMLLLVVPGIYLAVAYTFVVPMIVLERFQFWDAMETSRKVITQNWFQVFLLLLVVVLINILGALALGVGLLVSLPLSMLIVYATFEAVMGRSAMESNLDSQIEEIGLDEWERGE